MLAKQQAKAVYKPNFTAWFVLQGVLVAMRHPAFIRMRHDRALFFYEALAKAASNTRLLSKLIYHLPNRVQYRIGELVTTQGRLRHYFLRKICIEKHVRGAVDTHGCEQVVVLGAGLDVLSLQLAADYPHLHFIEIDLPDSQAFKVSSLHGQQVSLPANLEFISGDLRYPLSDVLGESSAYDPSKKTLWLAEGLFMFIPEVSVGSIFEAAKAMSSSGSVFIFTTLPCKEQGGLLARKLQQFYLTKEDSRLNWEIDYGQVEDFIATFGYRMIWQTDYKGLHQEHLSKDYHPEMAHIGENIHVAQC